MTENLTRDVAIIGSGPAGYTAAIYAARADLTPVVFEGSVTAGGALMTTTEVENFPGFDAGVTGPELMARMRSQAERFGAQLISDDVTEVDLSGHMRLVDGDGNVHEFRAVILAMGSAYRRLAVPGEDRLSGRGVSWCATCDGAFFRDQDVAVIGGGDSALEEALFLTRYARSVTVVHRRDRLRASKVMEARARAHPKIAFRWNADVVSVEGDDRVTALMLRRADSPSGDVLEVSGVFVAVGHEPRSELVKGVVGTDVAGYVVVQPGTTRTDVPGVFACGDLVDSRYRQAITAAGTGCAAALDAERFLTHTSEPTEEHP
jgi:thioredoxin reductase (NADPH)